MTSQMHSDQFSVARGVLDACWTYLDILLSMISYDWKKVPLDWRKSTVGLEKDYRWIGKEYRWIGEEYRWIGEKVSLH